MLAVELETHRFVVLYLLLRKLWNFLESGSLPRWRSRTAASGARKWILLVAVTAVDHEANLQTAHRRRDAESVEAGESTDV